VVQTANGPCTVMIAMSPVTAPMRPHRRGIAHRLARAHLRGLRGNERMRELDRILTPNARTAGSSPPCSGGPGTR
jgi:hypothetical protein